MSRNNTGNPIDSKAYADFEDNVANFDQWSISDADSFKDRKGVERLTLKGTERAGAGDTSVAVDAAARAVAAAGQVEENAEQIAQEAAQQAVDNVVVAVDGAVERAEDAATRAETASNSAATRADIYPDIATGIASVDDGEQFQVLSSDSREYLRYQREGGVAVGPIGRFPSAKLVDEIEIETLTISGKRKPLAGASDFLPGVLINSDGNAVSSSSYSSTGYIAVTPGTILELNLYASTGAARPAFFNESYTLVSVVPGNQTINEVSVPVPDGVAYIRLTTRLELEPNPTAYFKFPGIISAESLLSHKDLDTVYSSNLARKEGLVFDRLVNNSGNIQSGAGWVMIEIPVEEGESYTIGRLTLDPYGYCAFYDEEDALLSVTVHQTNEPKTFVAPAGAVLLRFDVARPANTPEDWSELTVNKGDVLLPYVPPEQISEIKGVPLLATGGQTSKDPSLERFHGLRLLVSGDSITQSNHHANPNWSGFLRNWLNLGSVQNDAISGAGLIKNNGVNYGLRDWPTEYGDVDIILFMGDMNDGTTSTASGTNAWNWIYGGEGDPHKDDFETEVTEENMASSMWFAWRYFIENVLDMYPNTPFGVIISQPRGTMAVKSGTPRAGYLTKNWGQDGWFAEWADAIEKLCAHYSVPVLNLYTSSGLRPWIPENNLEFFSNEDLIHPNTAGHRIMAQKILAFVRQFV